MNANSFQEIYFYMTRNSKKVRIEGEFKRQLLEDIKSKNVFRIGTIIKTENNRQFRISSHEKHGASYIDIYLFEVTK